MRYQVLAFACALAVVTYIHRIGFAVGAPAIGDSLGLDQTQVGYLMAAFQVAYGIFQVPGGLLGDRLGGRRVLTILVLGWSLLIGAAAIAMLSAAWNVAAFRVPAGAAIFLRHVPGRRVSRRWAGSSPTGCPRPSGAVPRARSGCSADGAVRLIPFLLIWLFRVWGSWPIPFLLIAALGLLWCGSILALVSRPARGDAAGQSRRAEDHRGRPEQSFCCARSTCRGKNGSGPGASGRCA